MAKERLVNTPPHIAWLVAAIATVFFGATGHAQVSNETKSTIGKIMFSGEMTDADIETLTENIIRDQGMQEDITDECRRYMHSMAQDVRDNRLDFSRITKGADKCVNSQKKMDSSDRNNRVQLPDLPNFLSNYWKKDKLNFGNSYYKIIDMERSSMSRGFFKKRGKPMLHGWSHAQRWCWSMDRGRLATIETSEEDDFVRSIYRERGRFYIGLYRGNWVRPVASGKDSDPFYERYQNFLPRDSYSQVSKKKRRYFSVGKWGVYDRGQIDPFFLWFWKETEVFYGWREMYPEDAMREEVYYALCEWDRDDWENVTTMDQLARSKWYARIGGSIGTRYNF